MQNASNKDPQFGSIRSWLWPIHSHELPLVLPMVVMLFLVCFNYGILKSMKESLVVTASGAVVLPFLKVWAILPAAFLSTWFYTKLSNHLSQARIFNLIIGSFLLYFCLFVTVLYPNRESLHAHGLADALSQILPKGFSGLVGMVRYWTFTLFYIAAELWGSLCLTVLFWGFANEVTKVKEAKRFYGAYSLASNLAAIAAGAGGLLLTQTEYNPYLPFGKDAWEQSQFLIVGATILSGLLVLAIHRHLHSKEIVAPRDGAPGKGKKAKMSLKTSLAHLTKSPYLLRIATLIIGYNLVINMVEVIWKDQLRLLYPDKVSYNRCLSNLLMYVGLISTTTALPMAGILQRKEWTFIALITPIVMLVTSLGFFGSLFVGHYTSSPDILILGMSPLTLCVFFGALQNVLSKAAKYSVFDTSKEMAFIPLPREAKIQGKAAIDGVGSRFAKSGSSLMHQGLLLCFGSLTASAPVVAIVVCGVTTLWISAVHSLGQMFKARSQGQSCEAEHEEESKSREKRTEKSPKAPQVA